MSERFEFDQHGENRYYYGAYCVGRFMVDGHEEWWHLGGGGNEFPLAWFSRHLTVESVKNEIDVIADAEERKCDKSIDPESEEAKKYWECQDWAWLYDWACWWHEQERDEWEADDGLFVQMY